MGGRLASLRENAFHLASVLVLNFFAEEVLAKVRVDGSLNRLLGLATVMPAHRLVPAAAAPRLICDQTCAGSIDRFICRVHHRRLARSVVLKNRRAGCAQFNVLCEFLPLERLLVHNANIAKALAPGSEH